MSSTPHTVLCLCIGAESDICEICYSAMFYSGVLSGQDLIDFNNLKTFSTEEIVEGVMNEVGTMTSPGLLKVVNDYTKIDAVDLIKLLNNMYHNKKIKRVLKGRYYYTIA